MAKIAEVANARLWCRDSALPALQTAQVPSLDSCIGSQRNPVALVVALAFVVNVLLHEPAVDGQALAPCLKTLAQLLAPSRYCTNWKAFVDLDDTQKRGFAARAYLDEKLTELLWESPVEIWPWTNYRQAQQEMSP